MIPNSHRSTHVNHHQALRAAQPSTSRASGNDRRKKSSKHFAYQEGDRINYRALVNETVENLDKAKNEKTVALALTNAQRVLSSDINTEDISTISLHAHVAIEELDKLSNSTLYEYAKLLRKIAECSSSRKIIPNIASRIRVTRRALHESKNYEQETKETLLECIGNIEKNLDTRSSSTRRTLQPAISELKYDKKRLQGNTLGSIFAAIAKCI